MTEDEQYELEQVPDMEAAEHGASEAQINDPEENQVLEQITEPLRKREGIRHLWLGDTGQGKTVANDQLLRWIRKKRLVDITLTVDDKNAHAVQYVGGTLRTNPEHLRKTPVKDNENARHIIFRGIAETKRPGPDVDNLVSDSFQMAWELVRDKPCQVLVNIDELADASDNQHWIGGTNGYAAQSYRKGRAVGISIVATTQLPQLLPREAFGLSETIGIFRLTTREAAYLAKYRVIEESEVEPIANLKVGQFRLFRKSHPLDPRIYKFINI